MQGRSCYYLGRSLNSENLNSGLWVHTFNLARFVTYLCSESASAAVNHLCVSSVKHTVVCEGERGVACSPVPVNMADVGAQPWEGTGPCSDCALPLHHTWREAVQGPGRSTAWSLIRASWEVLLCLTLGSTCLCKAILLPSEINRCLGMATYTIEQVLVAWEWR